MDIHIGEVGGGVPERTYNEEINMFE